MAGSVPSNVIELLHRHFPKGTNIVLPGGLPFNAMVITPNSNCHAHNNRLSNTASNNDSEPHPGMSDKFRPEGGKNIRPSSLTK